MPIYQDIKKAIQGAIQEGTYKPGDKIPSERELSLQYEVSRMTIRQAILELDKEGAIHREKGRGTFVSTPNLFQENLKSFTQTLIDQNMEPTTKVLEVSSVMQLKKISQHLGLPMSEPYYKIKRLRLGDGVPIALETVYIPIKHAEGLIQHDMTLSLYKTLEGHYGYELTHIACEIEASISNRIVMEAMELKSHTALLKISGVTYAQEDQKLFYEESFYRSDLYKYHVDILRRPL